MGKEFMADDEQSGRLELPARAIAPPTTVSVGPGASLDTKTTVPAMAGTRRCRRVA